MNGIECHLLSKKYQMIYYSNLEQSQRQVLGLQQTFVQCGKCNDTKRGFFAMSCRCLAHWIQCFQLWLFCYFLWLFWCWIWLFHGYFMTFYSKNRADYDFLDIFSVENTYCIMVEWQADLYISFGAGPSTTLFYIMLIGSND